MLHKISLRQQVKDLLISRVTSGTLAIGEKISLAGLAKDLDVSATPIREAISQLEQSGIVEYKINQGFYIKRIDPGHAKDIYHTIGLIEAMAVTNSEWSPKQIANLKRIHLEIQTEINPLKRQQKDLQFHELLIKSYSNTTLKKVLKSLKTTVFINELEYMKSEFIEKTNETHDKIIDLIENKNFSEVKKAIVDHWDLSYEFIEKCSAVPKSYNE
ncbi:GntR family transcriptional regulator [Portibacter marinus]|uniref:GntR family transcriptional regulator n=1 Tax=Portibacter marinus TaxID=2898660 RepID=UPI001F478F88|nr:GntR family transcriptional regulator [Portibacter marinus]